MQSDIEFSSDPSKTKTKCAENYPEIIAIEVDCKPRTSWSFRYRTKILYVHDHWCKCYGL